MNTEHFDENHSEPPLNIPETPQESRESPRFAGWWVGGWVAPTLAILFTIFWALGIYLMIGNRARDWDYSVVPYVPAQSYISTRSFSTRTVPKQVELPSVYRRIGHGM